MSFIHDALKKAQQRKDSSYSSYEKLISGPRQPVKQKKRRLPGPAIITAALAVLFGAAMIIYQESSGINFSTGKSPFSPEKSRTEEPAPTAQPQEPPPDTAALYQEALKNQLANDNVKAESLYRQVIAASPGHADALNNLGVILMAAGKSESAARESIDMFNKAISIRPDFADAYYNLACSYARLRNVEDGLKYLEHAVLIKPGLAAFADRDADLQNLRSSPRFKQVINKK